MTNDISTPSIARTKQRELDRPAQYASDEVSTRCLAVSNGLRHGGVRPMIAGQFSRIFRTRRASNRRSIMASHDNADIKTNNFCGVGRVAFLLDVYSQFIARR
jgi:hypothetical protein